jgi:hypothetical protein
LNKLGYEYKADYSAFTEQIDFTETQANKETLGKFREQIGELRNKINGIKESMVIFTYI